MSTLQKIINTGRFTKLNQEQLLAVTWWIEVGIKKKNESFEELLHCAIIFYSMDDKDFIEMPANLLSHIYDNKELLRDFKAMCILQT